MKSGKLKPALSSSRESPLAPALLAEIRGLIDAARARTVQLVNTELVRLYWSIGASIRENLLAKKRAGYGREIVVTLSRELVAEYGQGFSEKNLRRMIQLAELFPEKQKVVTLSRHLCAEKTTEHVELLRLEESGIRVAEYMTELPPRRLMERKLHEAIHAAQQALAARSEQNV